MLTLHVEADSFVDLIKKIARELNANITVMGTPETPSAESATAPEAPQTEAPAAKRGRKPASPHVPGSPQTGPTPEQAATPPVESARPDVEVQTEVEEGSDEQPDEPTYDYETQVKPAVVNLAAKKGRDTVVALLKDFGVGNASDIPAERYADFMSRIAELLAA